MAETDQPRLIEFAFPLKQTSLDSVHEKNVRHGHISTLHIWPARRPLAACRAALIATLLPDPGTPEGRRELCEKIAGKVVKKIEKKKMPGGQVVEREKEETEGGILHWGRETENAETLEWFRQEIRKAYGGRAPKVLDPFAGGGAIPLEAMRLGCEATAIDINPVAWFILKCTLEYPQKLAGKTLPLPAFILDNEEFMTAFYKAHPHLAGRTKRTKKQQKEFAQDLFMQGKDDSDRAPKADLAWHVRAWGQWVLDKARRDLARFYPVYADFEPLVRDVKSYERQPMRLVPLKEDGTPDIDSLNAEFGEKYLENKANPRWVAKPTVAYLWARTMTCKNCRATIPLLKTRWLCRKDRKRVLLTMELARDKAGTVCGVETDVPVRGSNAAQRREHDKRLGAGTMTGAGAKCPCCGVIMTWEDLRIEGQARQFGRILLATVGDGMNGKEYRLPCEHEAALVAETVALGNDLFEALPFGLPVEPTPEPFGPRRHGAALRRYGMTRWADMFTSRQLLALGVFVFHTRAAKAVMHEEAYPVVWIEALSAYLALAIDRIVDRGSVVCHRDMGYEKIANTFAGFRFSMSWDFAEANVVGASTGSYGGQLEWIGRVIDHASSASNARPTALCQSAVRTAGRATDYARCLYDLILTDPPYYDAISYSDLMDFFHVWLRRSLQGVSSEIDAGFMTLLGPKWDHEDNNGELIDDPSRHGWDRAKAREVYEDGMYRAFLSCNAALRPDGRFVVIFAHKEANAWETLVSAIIRAGFVVDASWPIQTEMGNRTRALSSSALASSVWLICKKRPIAARAGWDNNVLEEMRANIRQRLRDFWDAGIRGPDFVWAATGPALEAYSKHPVVKMANDPGQTLTVSEFLNHARRMVVDFVVGRVLEKSGDGAVEAAVDRLDEATAYYLLHRNDFGLDDAPVGACILYATACSLSDQALVRDWDLLMKSKEAAEDTEDTEGEEDQDSDSVDSVSSVANESGSKVKLKPWNQRRSRSLGYEAPGGRPVPLIDRIHRLMLLWKAGDAHKVDEYLDEHGLRRHELFRRVLQSLIELSKAGSEERSLLESLSNHIGAKGAKKKEQQPTFREMADGAEEE
jgi:adenine-specific DNA methylase